MNGISQKNIEQLKQLKISNYFDFPDGGLDDSAQNLDSGTQKSLESAIQQNLNELRLLHQKGTIILAKHKKAAAEQDVHEDVGEIMDFTAALSSYLTYTEPKLKQKNISKFTGDVNERLKNALPSTAFNGETKFRDIPRQKTTVMWESQAQQQIQGAQQDIRDLDAIFLRAQKAERQEEDHTIIDTAAILQGILSDKPRVVNTTSHSQHAGKSYGGGNYTIKKSKNQGRKSLRVIMDELEAKLDLIRTNQTEMEALIKRVIQYKKDEIASKRSGNAAVLRNIRNLAECSPESRRRQIQLQKKQRDEHLQQVLEHKKQMDETLREKKMEVIAKKNIQSGLGQAARKQKVEEVLFNAIRQKWAILVLVGSRMFAAQNAMLEDQLREMERIRQFRAAKAIQREWRRYYNAKYQGRIAKSVAIIGHAIIKYLPRFREQMRERAATVLIDFLHEAHSVSRLMKVIKTYRFKVVICQRTIKSFLTVRDARLHLLQLQWEKIEPQWWAKRTPVSKKSNKAKAKKVESGPEARIPIDIRDNLLLMFLSKKTQDYANAYYSWYEKYSHWKRQIAERQEALQLLSDQKKNNQVSLASDVSIPDLRTHPVTKLPLLIFMNPMMTYKEACELMEIGLSEAVAEND